MALIPTALKYTGLSEIILQPNDCTQAKALTFPSARIRCAASLGHPHLLSGVQPKLNELNQKLCYDAVPDPE